MSERLLKAYSAAAVHTPDIIEATVLAREAPKAADRLRYLQEAQASLFEIASAVNAAIAEQSQVLNLTGGALAKATAALGMSERKHMPLDVGPTPDNHGTLGTPWRINLDDSDGIVVTDNQGEIVWNESWADVPDEFRTETMKASVRERVRRLVQAVNTYQGMLATLRLVDETLRSAIEKAEGRSDV